MKKFIALLVILLGFTATSVYADYTQPTNLYEYTFTTAEETHIISNPRDFFYEKLSVADVYYDDELVVNNGSTGDTDLWYWVDYPEESHFVLFDGGFNAVVVIFYDLGSYVNLSLGIDVEYAAGAMYKPIAGTYKIGVEVEANQPIRPQISVDNVVGNTFDLEITNYNDYMVTFVLDIYDSAGNLILANAYATGIDANSSRISNINYLDWIEGTAFEYDTSYKIDGYFTSSQPRFEPSERSDRLTINTGAEVEYAVDLSYLSTRGEVDYTGDTAFPRDMLTFEASAYSGFRFYGWQVTSGGVTESFNYQTNPLYYEMPYNDIEVLAIFSETNTQPGYKTFYFDISSTNQTYRTDNPEFFTKGRLRYATIYIDGDLIVKNGVVLDTEQWYPYANNDIINMPDTIFTGGIEAVDDYLYSDLLPDDPSYAGSGIIPGALDLVGTGLTYDFFMTVAYEETSAFNTNLQQGDINVWIAESGYTTPFELEILLPVVDPEPSAVTIGEVEENVPLNIDAALGLINADNLYGYISLFVFTILLSNFALMYLKATSIVYIVVNLSIGILYVSMGMLPIYVSIIWFGFIGIAFIATIKGGAVSE